MHKTILYMRTDLAAQHLTAGGSVAHTIGVIKGFADLKYKIIMASASMFPVIPQLPLLQFIPLVMPSWLSIVGCKISSLLSNIIFFYQTCRACSVSSVAFIYQRYSLLNSVGALLSWWYAVPLILEFNGSEVWIDEHWSKHRLVRMRFLVAWFERYNLKKAHTIVVVSYVLRDQLIKQGVSEQKIVVHPNGVDTAWFDPDMLNTPRQEIRATLALQNKVVVGFVGTFSYWHGITMLARIIPVVVQQWPHVHFLLIGDGPLREWLEHELQQYPWCIQQVHFVGTVAQQDARNYLAACDAFISPTQKNVDGSRFFGSPTKLFEYMSLAKPIIASDIEQLTEVMSPAFHVDDIKQWQGAINDQLGVLVYPDNEQGFVQAIGFVVNLAGEQREQMGLHARRKVTSHYTWAHHVNSIIRAIGHEGNDR